MLCRLRSPQAGQSLVEVSLALAVLFFGIGGAVDLYVTTERSAGRTRQYAAAQLLAAAKAEEVKAAGAAALQQYLESHLTPGAAAPTALYPPDKPLVVPAPAGFSEKSASFSWRATLEEAQPGAPDYPSIRVKSIVEWSDGASTRRAEQKAFVLQEK
ncbi:MAG: hypothetical protein NTW86_26545 [Candidatus Sumerlaeota bacterium]|nr:hypothetical protein [Candidatus Sumerlaeota bacterium]